MIPGLGARANHLMRDKLAHGSWLLRSVFLQTIWLEFDEPPKMSWCPILRAFAKGGTYNFTRHLFIGKSIQPGGQPVDGMLNQSRAAPPKAVASPHPPPRKPRRPQTSPAAHPSPPARP